MRKGVQFDSYGGIDVLKVRDVPRPIPETGEVLVKVRAAGINPSEAVIRSGSFKRFALQCILLRRYACMNCNCLYCGYSFRQRRLNSQGVEEQLFKIRLVMLLFSV